MKTVIAVNKKVIFVLLFMFTSVGVFLFAGSGSDTQKSNTVPEKTLYSKTEVKAIEKEDHADAEPVLNTQALKKTEKVFFVAKTKQVENAFRVVETEEMSTVMRHKKKVKPLSAFKVEKGIIRSLRVGDTIILPEINDVSYELKVEKFAIERKSKSVTLTASIEGEDDIYQALLTEGTSGYAYITVNSSSGIFEMEIYNGNGYIYNSKDIKNAMIDYSKTDALPPPPFH